MYTLGGHALGTVTIEHDCGALSHFKFLKQLAKQGN